MGTTALSAEQLARFRDQLQRLRSGVTAALDARLHGQEGERRDEAALPRRADETDDDAAAETQRSADLVHLSRSAEELDRIDAALARIADGSYGMCLDCEDPIDAQRLDAYPAALRCADCQEAFEKRRGLQQAQRS